MTTGFEYEIKFEIVLPNVDVQDGDHAHIRVTFNFGGTYEPFQRYAPNAVFLKELSFRYMSVFVCACKQVA